VPSYRSEELHLKQEKKLEMEEVKQKQKQQQEKQEQELVQLQMHQYEKLHSLKRKGISSKGQTLKGMIHEYQILIDETNSIAFNEETFIHRSDIELHPSKHRSEMNGRFSM
jgi:hypothetical protein